MTAAPKYLPPWKLRCGDNLASRTRKPWSEAGAIWEGTGKSTRGSRRGMGPSTYTRRMEITSGRSHFQQGLAATCKDREEERRQSRAEDLGLAHEPVRAKKEG